MPFWSKFFNIIENKAVNRIDSENSDSTHYAFVDLEVGDNGKVHDIGALRYDDAVYHGVSKTELNDFLSGVDYICGHNIIHHDLKYLHSVAMTDKHVVDTLYVSPLLLAFHKLHRLEKDDKLMDEQLNNPVNDCKKAKALLFEETEQWHRLPTQLQLVLASLLNPVKEFVGFLSFVHAQVYDGQLVELIKTTFVGKICSNVDFKFLVEKYPVELAYVLMLVDSDEKCSDIPPWMLNNYPQVQFVLRILRHSHCGKEGCAYCNSQLDIHAGLKQIFGYDNFRTFNGENLQEQAVGAALAGKNILTVFPTGGGKSLTFQLPALMAGRAVRGLTVVISPLQSLMKDQVDNLESRGIDGAVAINGLLDPISRSEAIKRVINGNVSLLYIAPEMLRSKTIERILLIRNVVRFVIDEAHCFSSWGHDFRVDYLYIGKFISKLQSKKQLSSPIPVSCFTATAKQNVIKDITDYFYDCLNIKLHLFASAASRSNLHYSVINVRSDEEKYVRLRTLIAENQCPTIVYVSRTRRTFDLADKLKRDGYKALPFNGRMSADSKVENQEAFMKDEVGVIVATSAFGMGVDKSDVGLVIHYDISDSIENYIQEAGRAGRNPDIQAKCYILYAEDDLNKHFILLNQTKLSINEIQQIWSAVKSFTKLRPSVCCSALELARQAGWNDTISDIETRVRAALSALEQAGYIERGDNVPHIYATGITVKNIDEARMRLEQSTLFDDTDVEVAVRIIKSLISKKGVTEAQDADAESRVDYIADILGLTKKEVLSAVERMRQDGILADTKDISVFLHDDTHRKSSGQFERFAILEKFILENLPDNDKPMPLSFRQLNDNAINHGVKYSKEKDIRTLLLFLSIRDYAHRKGSSINSAEVCLAAQINSIMKRYEKRIEICRFILDWLFNKVVADTPDVKSVQISVVELLAKFKSQNVAIFVDKSMVSLDDIEEALLYLSKIGVLQLEGGFLVLYNAMEIKRIKDSNLRYKIEDYQMLNEFYKLKIQQIHIVGEFARLMANDTLLALQFVSDYFGMKYKSFINKYFSADRKKEIQQNMTSKKYHDIFGTLSECQKSIIQDKDSRCIVVGAGPGSGKTRVLVHKLASLLLLEDVKHEQLLMLTFSRSAATEFKQRLIDLIGNAANYVEITTFHSYCFDLLGKMGNLDEAQNIVAQAVEVIKRGEVEPNKIRKTVLVIDEAQDMSRPEFDLIMALVEQNDDLRVIAVGDDDQNIYGFRGSDSAFMMKLKNELNGTFIEMIENYRSSKMVVDVANSFVKTIPVRLKTTPIISKSQTAGYVSVTDYSAGIIYEPLIDDLIKHKASNGSACILTKTNKEAATYLALLQKKGVNCRLIQSTDSFKFYNLAEMRYFIKYIDEHTVSPIISADLWEKAKSATHVKYAGSSSMAYVSRCIELFEQCNATKYIADFKNFVFDSSVEDFVDVAGADVVVSTIHKAKGREFDDVYISYVDENKNIDDEGLRCLYVAMTRAKQRLFIHTNNNNHLFQNLPVSEYLRDTSSYGMPSEVVLSMSLKDVYLDYFKEVKNEVLALRGGDKLVYANGALYSDASKAQVAKLSAKMLGSVRQWERKGYSVHYAVVTFVVAWKSKKETDKEYAALLADLFLVK